jgi:hypothetical protein
LTDHEAKDVDSMLDRSPEHEETGLAVFGELLVGVSSVHHLVD